MGNVKRTKEDQEETHIERMTICVLSNPLVSPSWLMYIIIKVFGQTYSDLNPGPPFSHCAND